MNKHTISRRRGGKKNCDFFVLFGWNDGKMDGSDGGRGKCFDFYNKKIVKCVIIQVWANEKWVKCEHVKKIPGTFLINTHLMFQRFIEMKMCFSFFHKNLDFQIVNKMHRIQTMWCIRDNDMECNGKRKNYLLIRPICMRHFVHQNLASKCKILINLQAEAHHDKKHIIHKNKHTNRLMRNKMTCEKETKAFHYDYSWYDFLIKFHCNIQFIQCQSKNQICRNFSQLYSDHIVGKLDVILLSQLSTIINFNECPRKFIKNAIKCPPPQTLRIQVLN